MSEQENPESNGHQTPAENGMLLEYMKDDNGNGQFRWSFFGSIPRDALMGALSMIQFKLNADHFNEAAMAQMAKQMGSVQLAKGAPIPGANPFGPKGPPRIIGGR